MVTLQEIAKLRIGHLDDLINIENSYQRELVQKLREYIHTIFEDKSEYIVLGNTRMFNLVESIIPDLLKLYPDEFSNISNKEYSPNSDLTINEITNYIKKNRYYPSVHIYDDLTYDGAKIAEFLYKLKENLKRKLDKDDYEIEKMLKDLVKIYTFSKNPNKDNTLINENYEIEPYTELQINEMNYLLTLIAYNNFSLGYSNIPYSALIEINEYFTRKITKNKIKSNDNFKYRGSSNEIIYNKSKANLSLINIKSNIEEFYFLSQRYFINTFIIPNIIDNESLDNYSIYLSYYLKNMLGKENKLSSLLESNTKVLNEGKMEIITYLMSIKEIRNFLKEENNNEFEGILSYLKFNNIYNKLTEYDFDKLYREIPFDFISFEHIINKYSEYSKENYKTFNKIKESPSFNKVNVTSKENSKLFIERENFIYEIGLDMQESIFSYEIRREKLVGNEDLKDKIEIDKYLSKIEDKDKLKSLAAFLVMSDTCFTSARFKDDKVKVKTLFKTE